MIFSKFVRRKKEEKVCPISRKRCLGNACAWHENGTCYIKNIKQDMRMCSYIIERLSDQIGGAQGKNTIYRKFKI